jgi:dATP/dGTP diphosphohydrolase/uncharacterized protein DUF4406
MTPTELNDLIEKLKAEEQVTSKTPTPIPPVFVSMPSALGGVGIGKSGTTANGSPSGKDSLELPTQVNPFAIYILGPMRGHDQYNFPAFYAMAEKLLAAGFDPVNPAQLDREDGFRIETLAKDHDFTKYPEGMDVEQVVRRDLKAIMGCAGYVALPGYEKSKGATAEKSVFDWRCAKRLALMEDGKFATVRNDLPPETPKDESNPKDRRGLKKAPLRLVPWVSIIQLARVMKLGADKYGEVNWREKKPRLTVYFEAALRHLLAYADGQNTDPESGESHLAHVMANMAILLDAESCNCLLDDRKTTGEVVKLLSVVNK